MQSSTTLTTHSSVTSVKTEIKEEKNVKTNTIEELIKLSRDAFLQLDKQTDSKLEIKLPPGVKARKLDDVLRVCTIELNGKSYTLFGVEKDRQNDVNLEFLRSAIAKELKIETTQFSQIIGDSFPFNVNGTLYAKQKMNEFLNLESVKKNIILFGATGRIRHCADTNGILNTLIDEQPDLSKRIIGNLVDEHTPAALATWGCKISANLTNFFLVYSNTDKPSVKFGADYISDKLTNALSACFEGGVQSLKQATDMINNRIPLLGFAGARDMNPNNFDPETGLPYLSATEFLSYIKNHIEIYGSNISQLKEAINSYFLKYALFFRAKGDDSDASTKLKLYEEFSKQFFNAKVWNQLEKCFNFIDEPSIIPMINSNRFFNLKFSMEQKEISQEEKVKHNKL